MADAGCQCVYVVDSAGALLPDGVDRVAALGAGNSPTEILVTVFERLGVPTGVDTDVILAVADEVAEPVISRLPVADRNSIIQGKYGVCKSFLFHAQTAAERYGVPAHEILARVGEAGYVGGQEDMIIDVALTTRRTRQHRRARYEPHTVRADR